MFGIADIIKAITENKIKISDHADEEAESDELKFDAVCYSVLQGEVIESYPDDKPYPSCLIFGRSFIGDPIHSVWGYNEKTKWVVIITVYRPDPEQWIDYRTRR